MSNKEIAETLNETAALMEIAGMDGFRIRSYRNAAVVIESLTESIEEVIRDDNRDVTKIKGIGKGIASSLTELVGRGSFARRDELLEKYPPTALELLKIPGLGPKSIAAALRRVPRQYDRCAGAALPRRQAANAASDG